jgi:hypothetical protein
MTDPERWAQVKALFDAALDLEGPARAAHLAEVCRNDGALRAEVERLLPLIPMRMRGKGVLLR